MTETHTGGRGYGAIRSENGNAAAIGAADWLYLAAAPTFAIMALLTGVLGGGSPDALCSIVSASPLSGMVPMYLLMSAFHTPPWLKLIACAVTPGTTSIRRCRNSTRCRRCEV